MGLRANITMRLHIFYSNMSRILKENIKRHIPALCLWWWNSCIKDEHKKKTLKQKYSEQKANQCNHNIKMNVSRYGCLLYICLCMYIMSLSYQVDADFYHVSPSSVSYQIIANCNADTRHLTWQGSSCI